MMVKHVKTSTGFETEIDEDILDNMELMEAVYAISDTDLKPFLTLANLLLKPEEKQKLYDHVRVDGRVPIKAFSDELTEIMNGLSSKKK